MDKENVSLDEALLEIKSKYTSPAYFVTKYATKFENANGNSFAIFPYNVNLLHRILRAGYAGERKLLHMTRQSSKTFLARWCAVYTYLLNDDIDILEVVCADKVSSSYTKNFMADAIELILEGNGVTRRDLGLGSNQLLELKGRPRLYIASSTEWANRGRHGRKNEGKTLHIFDDMEEYPQEYIVGYCRFSETFANEMRDERRGMLMFGTDASKYSLFSYLVTSSQLRSTNFELMQVPATESPLSDRNLESYKKSYKEKYPYLFECKTLFN